MHICTTLRFYFMFEMSKSIFASAFTYASINTKNQKQENNLKIKMLLSL